MKEETRYIFSKGDLSRKDFSICFRGERGNIYLPIKDTKELYCFNDITLSTKLLEILSKSGIVVHFFGYYENYVGTFYPKDYLLSGRLTVSQALAYDNQEKRLTIAKAIVKAISLNIHSVLYHYYRHGKSELKPFLDWLKKDVPDLLPRINAIKNLLSLEGEIWASTLRHLKHGISLQGFFWPARRRSRADRESVRRRQRSRAEKDCKVPLAFR